MSTHQLAIDYLNEDTCSKDLRISKMLQNCSLFDDVRSKYPSEWMDICIPRYYYIWRKSMTTTLATDEEYSYQEHEFFGDGQLARDIYIYIYHRNQLKSRLCDASTLTTAKCEVLSNDNLAEIAKFLKIGQFLHPFECLYITNKIFADLLEALIGATFKIINLHFPENNQLGENMIQAITFKVFDLSSFPVFTKIPAKTSFQQLFLDNEPKIIKIPCRHNITYIIELDEKCMLELMPSNMPTKFPIEIAKVVVLKNISDVLIRRFTTVTLYEIALKNLQEIYGVDFTKNRKDRYHDAVFHSAELETLRHPVECKMFFEGNTHLSFQISKEWQQVNQFVSHLRVYRNDTDYCVYTHILKGEFSDKCNLSKRNLLHAYLIGMKISIQSNISLL